MKADEKLIESLPGDLSAIARVAGIEAAVKIAKAFKGTHLYIPDLLRHSRDEAIKQAYDSGETARGIAIKYGISERHVWRILKQPAGETADKA